MIAIDTNVVVRLLVNDDPAQVRRARKIISQDEIWVPTTVLLETEWVLRAAYGLGRADTLSGLRTFLGLPGVITEDIGRISQALTDFEAGLDFADALHLAWSSEAEAFATFDQNFIRQAKRHGRTEVIAV